MRKLMVFHLYVCVCIVLDSRSGIGCEAAGVSEWKNGFTCTYDDCDTLHLNAWQDNRQKNKMENVIHS